MKKLLVVLFILLLSGCAEETTIDKDINIQQGGNILFNNVQDIQMQVDIEESDLPADTYQLLTENRIYPFAKVADKFTFIYQGYEPDEMNQTLVVLNSDYSIEWTYDQEDILTYQGSVDGDKLLIRTCVDYGDCEYKVFDLTGQVLLTVEDLETIETIDSTSYSTRLKTGQDGYFYGFREIENDYGQKTYQFFKSNNVEDVVIYEVTASFATHKMLLDDDSMVLITESSNDKFTVAHIQSDGEVEVLYDNVTERYNVVGLHNGFLLSNEDKVIRYDLNDSIVWQMDVGRVWSVLEETEDYIVFTSDSKEYKVYSDGSYEVTQATMFTGYALGYATGVYYIFDNDSKLVRTYSNEFTGIQYLDDEGEVIWQYELEEIYSVVLHENNVYINISETEIVRLDSDGLVAERFEINGVLQFITEDGNFIVRTDEDDIVTGESVETAPPRKFQEVTTSGEVIWETESFLGNLEMYNIGNGYYASGFRISYTCFHHPGLIIPPSYKDIYTTDGVLVYSFEVVSAKLLFEKNGVYYYTARKLIPEEINRTKDIIVAFDGEFNAIAEYDYNYLLDENVIGPNRTVLGLKDGKLYTFEMTYVEAP